MNTRNRTRVLAAYTIEQGQKDRLQELANRLHDGNASQALSSLIESFDMPPAPPKPVLNLYKPLKKIDREAEQQKKAKVSTANRVKRGREILEKMG